MATHGSYKHEYLDIQGLLAVLRQPFSPDDVNSLAFTSVDCTLTRWGWRWPDSSFSVSVTVATNCAHDAEEGNPKWFRFTRAIETTFDQPCEYRFFGCEYGHEVVLTVVHAIAACATLTHATLVCRNFQTYGPELKDGSDLSGNSSKQHQGGSRSSSQIESTDTTIRSKLLEKIFAIVGQNHALEQDSASETVRTFLQQMNYALLPIHLRVSVKPSHHAAVLKAVMDMTFYSKDDRSMHNGLALGLQVFRGEGPESKDDHGAGVEATILPIDFDFQKLSQFYPYSMGTRVSSLIATKDVTTSVRFKCVDSKALDIVYCGVQGAQAIAELLRSGCGLHTLCIGGTYSEEVVRLLLGPLAPDRKGQQSNSSLDTLKFFISANEVAHNRRSRLEIVVRTLETNKTLRHVEFVTVGRRLAKQSCVELQDITRFYEALRTNTTLQSFMFEDWAFLRVGDALQPSFCGEFPKAPPRLCLNKKPIKEYKVIVKME